MSNKDETNRVISASEPGKLEDKYSQMKQNFEGVKKQAYEPQIQGLGQGQETNNVKVNKNMSMYDKAYKGRA